jgi:hypothetical protein
MDPMTQYQISSIRLMNSVFFSILVTLHSGQFVDPGDDQAASVLQRGHSQSASQAGQQDG